MTHRKRNSSTRKKLIERGTLNRIKKKSKPKYSNNFKAITIYTTTFQLKFEAELWFYMTGPRLSVNWE